MPAQRREQRRRTRKQQQPEDDEEDWLVETDDANDKQQQQQQAPTAAADPTAALEDQKLQASLFLLKNGKSTETADEGGSSNNNHVPLLRSLKKSKRNQSDSSLGDEGDLDDATKSSNSRISFRLFRNSKTKQALASQADNDGTSSNATTISRGDSTIASSSDQATTTTDFFQHQNGVMATDDDDPVLALFQSRNTQRVRFCLEHGTNSTTAAAAAAAATTAEGGGARYEKQVNLTESGSGEENLTAAAADNHSASASSSSSAAGIRKFMRGALFGHGGGGSFKSGDSAGTHSSGGLASNLFGSYYSSRVNSARHARQQKAANKQEMEEAELLEAEVAQEIERVAASESRHPAPSSPSASKENNTKTSNNANGSGGMAQSLSQIFGSSKKSVSPTSGDENNKSPSPSSFFNQDGDYSCTSLETDSQQLVTAAASDPNDHTLMMVNGADSNTAAVVFVEDPSTRSHVMKLLNKATRAQVVHFRYEYAVKCCMRALELLQNANYPDQHPKVVKTLENLNHAHHALSAYKNSANIVKMGIRYEDSGDLIRALKMYTIAYRIRRDNLSQAHPSLVVLLNMLASIQMKRGELEEAMEIYELALKDDEAAAAAADAAANTSSLPRPPQPQSCGNDQDSLTTSTSKRSTSTAGGSRKQYGVTPGSNNVLAKSVAYREMGTIYEKWGDAEEALKMYHLSLDCIAEYKGLNGAAAKAASMTGTLAALQEHPEEGGGQPEDLALNGSGLSQSSSTTGIVSGVPAAAAGSMQQQDFASRGSALSEQEILIDLQSVKMAKSFNKGRSSHVPSVMTAQVCKAPTVANHHHHRGGGNGGTTTEGDPHLDDDDYGAGMELIIGTSTSTQGADAASTASRGSSVGSGPIIGGKFRRKSAQSATAGLFPPLAMTSRYDIFFPPSLDQQLKKSLSKRGSGGDKNKLPPVKTPAQLTANDYANLDVALTLHQIGQLHRGIGEFNLALAAYVVALRGMRHALGPSHPNVAAVLGNLGNLQKEMGDYNAAFTTYQQVLTIESQRLGLSHPDVAVTLHNIATIDAARGNYPQALHLYRQVMTLQIQLFGDDDDCIAVTCACMGDVYERIADLQHATECFEEALRIKTASHGRHSLDVARLLHKLAKLSVVRGDYHLADSFISRTVLVYRLNKLLEDDEWLVDANRDAADIDAAITMGRGMTFEC